MSFDSMQACPGTRNSIYGNQIDRRRANSRLTIDDCGLVVDQRPNNQPRPSRPETESDRRAERYARLAQFRDVAVGEFLVARERVAVTGVNGEGSL